MAIASVALANALNTNLPAHRRRDYFTVQCPGRSPALMPVHVVETQPMPLLARALSPVTADDPEIEVRRGDTVVIVRDIPNQSTMGMGMVVRELLRLGFGAPN